MSEIDLSDDKVSVELRIDEVKTRRFEFNEPEEEPKQESWPNFDISVGFRVDIEDNKIWVRVNSSAIREHEKLFEIVTDTGYEVKNLSDFPQDEESVEIPDRFGIDLASWAISTTRGILIEKMSGTTLRKVILPPIDPGVLLDDEGGEA